MLWCWISFQIHFKWSANILTRKKQDNFCLCRASITRLFYEEPPSVTILSPSLLFQPLSRFIAVCCFYSQLRFLSFLGALYSCVFRHKQTNSLCFALPWMFSFRVFQKKRSLQSLWHLPSRLSSVSLSSTCFRQRPLFTSLCHWRCRRASTVRLILWDIYVSRLPAPRPRRAAVASLACSLLCSVKFVYFMPH